MVEDYTLNNAQVHTYALLVSIFFVGPDLPIPLLSFKMVEFDGKLIAVGGFNGLSNQGSDALYKLVCSDDDCEWQEMSQKLSVGKYAFVAMMVPDELTNCKQKE